MGGLNVEKVESVLLGGSITDYRIILYRLEKIRNDVVRRDIETLPCDTKEAALQVAGVWLKAAPNNGAELLVSVHAKHQLSLGVET